MIYLLCKYDIISVPSYAEGIYHRTTVRYHIEDISPVPQGTDIIEKDDCFGNRLFLARRKGCVFCEAKSTVLTASRSDLDAKNSPPDCFLNASTLSGFESLPVNKNKDKPTARVNLSLFAKERSITVRKWG